MPLVSATGDIKWAATLSEHVVVIDGGLTWRTNWGTPAVTADRVFTFDMNGDYQETREIYAVDRESGEHKWITQLDLGDSWSLEGHVVAGSGHVFVLAIHTQMVAPSSGDSSWDGTRRVFALDTTTGAIDWDWESNGKVPGPPAYANGTLYMRE